MESDWLTYLVLAIGLIGLWLVYRQPRDESRRRGNLLTGAGVVVVFTVLLALLTLGLG